MYNYFKFKTWTPVHIFTKTTPKFKFHFQLILIMRGKLLACLFLVNLVVGLPVIMLGIVNPENILILLTLTTIIQITTSYYIIKENLGDYNIDLLVLLSTASVYILSIYGMTIQQKTYFYITGILILIYYITKLIEQKTYQGIQKTFSDLYKLLPKKVKVIRNGKEKMLSIKSLSEGDIIIIASGKKVPVDGEIVSGSSCVDESLITGESQEVEKERGDKVIAGTIVIDGMIKVKVERLGEDTYLSQIVDLIKNVEESKTQNKKRLAKSYKAFMFFIILSSLATFGIWKFLGVSTYNALQKATTVLVISSNASLVLATPIAIIFAIITLTKNGIIVKNPRSVEMLPEINTYVFDKTGTLTEGKWMVDQIKTLNDFSCDEVIKYFLIAEKNSSHVLVKILYDQLDKNKRVPEPDHFREYFGMGVYARYKDHTIHVGKESLLNKFNIEKDGLPEDLQNTVIVCVDRKPMGLIEFQDTLKEASKELVEFLKKRGNEIIMLTGDTKTKAERIGEELGIEKIFSEVTPENKLEIVKELREKGRLVMIGDGINDAPSLAQADVGISVNNELDLIKESADVVLTRNDLTMVKKLIKISDFTQTKIRQNLFWTYTYNLAAVVIASGLLMGLGLTVSPLLACAASVSSTISIMINSFLFR